MSYSSLDAVSWCNCKLGVSGIIKLAGSLLAASLHLLWWECLITVIVLYLGVSSFLLPQNIPRQWQKSHWRFSRSRILPLKPIKAFLTAAEAWWASVKVTFSFGDRNKMFTSWIINFFLAECIARNSRAIFIRGQEWIVESDFVSFIYWTSTRSLLFCKSSVTPTHRDKSCTKYCRAFMIQLPFKSALALESLHLYLFF